MKKNKIYLIMSAFVIASCCVLTGCGKANIETSEVSENQEYNIDESNKKQNLVVKINKIVLIYPFILLVT